MRHIKVEPLKNQTSFPIALVVSQFNQEVTTELQQGALRRLIECGFDLNDITLVEVPGAVEIPLVARNLAMKNIFRAIIALGAVIRGETTHYDYVCQQVSAGCQRVALEVGVPVIFGVLTTETEAQAWDRLGGSHGHKGVDAVDCAISLCGVLTELSKF